jgi:hypothetical protein
MSGSSLIPIVVPITAFLTMAVWLGMVFYAAAHPGYPRRAKQRNASGTAAAIDETAGVEHHEALAGAGHSPGPREHERIDEYASGTAHR